MRQDAITSKEIKKSIWLSGREKQARKRQVLNQGRPSIIRSIADAVVIKSENVFFLTRPDGNVPLGDSHGYGLYYHDCRFLNGYELALPNTTSSPAAMYSCFGFHNQLVKKIHIICSHNILL